MHYKAPRYKLSAFNCPHCHAFSQINWHELSYGSAAWLNYANTDVAICTNCHKQSLWTVERVGDVLQTQMVYPSINTAPQAHADMPDEIKADFEEARSITKLSSRGAAALLRLCVQKLCKVLKEPGKNINEDIGSLVKKGLPTEIQQALDALRVIGNNAVHPGAMDDQDIQNVSPLLFELVNHIVEDRISRPKRFAKLYSNLPKPALDGIEKRDAIKP